MEKTNLIQQLPFAAARDIHTLVENRKAYTLNSFELNVYETYEPTSLVPLKFDDLVIINMLKGKKVMHINDVDPFEYLPGETIILPAYKPMEIDFPNAKLNDPTQCTALVISSDKINDTIDFLNNKYPRDSGRLSWDFSWDKFHFANSSELALLTDKLFAVMIGTDPFKDALADILFKELLIRIIQLQQFESLKGASSISNGPITFLKNFIRQHINEKLTVDLLCNKVNMSKASLFRLFKDEFGVTPMELVIQERLIKAKEMLKTNLSVKEVCYACGFSDVNYFVRLFRSRENLTPGNFQRKFNPNVS